PGLALAFDIELVHDPARVNHSEGPDMADADKPPAATKAATAPASAVPPPAAPPAKKTAVLPKVGEVITTVLTGNTYTIGEKIGEGKLRARLRLHGRVA